MKVVFFFFFLRQGENESCRRTLLLFQDWIAMKDAMTSMLTAYLTLTKTDYLAPLQNSTAICIVIPSDSFSAHQDGTRFT